ncbi:fructose-bisphosphate aldolase class II [Hydrogenispora ethanolica]|jgi:fructose-bisphosphate aldolase class II|uniref:Fructose-bisphosphate aldolase class II n=1 Tax=Hydrogenispora ethanolica TaxID=1082276 RepID=A0A4R1SAB5_HYDET|nr:class II fructose-bisphosphate aldolase [Hydrogenispora ethanolica]TCL76455.1 fructose-bisphosphate aldolase class II [Hydrogenispora ethanolica]
MYVTMKKLLDDAHQHGYAVIAANCINLEMARGIIDAAIEENAPIILNIGQGQMTNHADGELMSGLIQRLAQRTPVPIALNLDHGKDYERLTHAFRHGFSSVMIDASQYPLEENIRLTQEIVKLAHSQGVTVEAELGKVGMASQGDQGNQSFFTDPEEAKYFVAQTQVDALAVAIGTAHGSYPKGMEPKIDFERLKAIKALLNMPLVLHGGSNSGDENIRQAVAHGINKINVATDNFNACRDFLARQLAEHPDTDFLRLMIDMENAVKESTRRYIRLSGSAGRAAHFVFKNERAARQVDTTSHE